MEQLNRMLLTATLLIGTVYAIILMPIILEGYSFLYLTTR
jgi:hypothetical protein